MTRGSIPRFDLYDELEVSRQASGEVIEAAYRALVKRHHPDVATPEDRERIKRLNVAREWLVSPARRARYDAAAVGAGRAGGAVRRQSATPASAGARQRSRAGGPATGAAAGSAAGAGSAEPGSSSRASSPSSFGVNSGEVRQFLAELRELDESRAARLIGARDGLDAAAYADARRAALTAGRRVREAEWLFARDAAAVIAKGKLAFSPLSPVVSAIVADIAGAIVVRDLIQAVDLDLLLQPWRQSAVSGPAPGGREGSADRLKPRPGGRPALAGLSGRTLRGRGERLPLGLGILASGVLLFVAASALGLGPRRPESAVAGLTSPPSPGGVAVVGTQQPAPPSSPPGWPSPGLETPASAPTGSGEPPTATPVGLPTTRPTAPDAPSRTTPAPSPPRPTIPASPSPGPTPAPTPGPTPSPTPSPAPPTPTPPVDCAVVNLVGVNTSNAQLAWSTAGFTGTVLFAPPIPPQYKIAWQSLTPGSLVACSSDISVAATTP